ncbi:MAG: hypothetical protein R3B72_40600 [Polyangiaceae bacterium]
MMRGRVEPVLLLAIYAAVEPAELIHRCHIPLPQPGPLPNTVVPEVASGLAVAWGAPDQPPFVLLAVAFEADGGTDIQRVYGALERPRELGFWPMDGAAVEPLSLDEIARDDQLFHRSARMQLLRHGVQEAEACEDDELVGAAVSVFTGNESSGRLRLHFLSADGRNDWTALVSCDRKERA